MAAFAVTLLCIVIAIVACASAWFVSHALLLTIILVVIALLICVFSGIFGRNNYESFWAGFICSVIVILPITLFLLLLVLPMVSMELENKLDIFGRFFFIFFGFILLFLIDFIFFYPYLCGEADSTGVAILLTVIASVLGYGLLILLFYIAKEDTIGYFMNSIMGVLSSS